MGTTFKIPGDVNTVTVEVSATDQADVSLLIVAKFLTATVRAMPGHARGLGIQLIEAADKAEELSRQRAYQAAHGKTRRKRAEAAARRAAKKGGAS